MNTWPIRWGSGGIGWQLKPMMGVPSVYVVLRFGNDERKAFGWILRWLPSRRTPVSRGLVARIVRVAIFRYT